MALYHYPNFSNIRIILNGISGFGVFISFMTGSIGAILSRNVRETLSPPCFFVGEQCSTATYPPISNESLGSSLGIIDRKIIGAKHTAQNKIESDMENRWNIVLAEIESIPVHTENGMDLYMTDDSSNFCSKTQNVYERLNELAYYIEFLRYQEGGAISSNLETNMKVNFIDWQDEIYRCMCEMKLLLRSLNCDPCSTVPSGNLSTYFRSMTGSESIVDQQKAAYWVVLTGISSLTNIHTYLQLAIQDLSS